MRAPSVRSNLVFGSDTWLGQELPEKDQDGRTSFAPRCVKDVVEERLFAPSTRPLTRLDLGIIHEHKSFCARQERLSD